MARPLRIEFPDAYYHVMNRGLEQRKIALEEKDHQYLIELLVDIAQRWQVKIFAYCLMPSHYHLFLKTPQGNLSRVMRHLDSLYTQHFNRTHRRDGPLFRGRYKAVLVDADNYLLQLVRYIHLNAVKAGTVKSPGDYPWSSHRLYLSPKPIPWFAKDGVLSFFSGPHAFDKFVAQDNDKSLDIFYQRERSSPILGEEAFVNLALKSLPKEEPRHSRSEKTPQFPDLGVLLKKVSERFNVPEKKLLDSRPGQENAARNLAIYLASRKAGFSHRDICQKFNLGTDSAVSRVCHRMGERLSDDTQLSQALEALLN